MRIIIQAHLSSFSLLLLTFLDQLNIIDKFYPTYPFSFYQLAIPFKALFIPTPSIF